MEKREIRVPESLSIFMGNSKESDGTESKNERLGYRYGKELRKVWREKKCGKYQKEEVDDNCKRGKEAVWIKEDVS